MANKKIALVIPSLQAGGMERVMVEISYYLCSIDNMEVTMVSYTKGEIAYTLPDKIRYIEPKLHFNKKWRLISTFKTLLFLRKNLRSIQPNAVLSFGETYNSFVLISAIFLKIPIFISDRSRPDKSWGFIQDLLRKFLYKYAAGIVSQTTYSKQYLEKLTNSTNILVIPNPVRLNPKVLYNQDNMVILSVGRLIETKKFDHLINIFSEIPNNGWELWIAGDGPLKGTLNSLIKIKQLENRVKLLGHVSDITTLYTKASIFAFTSISEGFPNVLLEAHAAGLPCIAYDCVAGPSDIIVHEKTGFLVNAGDMERYKAHLVLMMADSTLRQNFSLNALQHISAFRIEKIGAKYLNFLLDEKKN